VLEALNQVPDTGKAGLKQLSDVTQTDIPAQVADLFAQPILHKTIIDPEQISRTLRQEML